MDDYGMPDHQGKERRDIFPLSYSQMALFYHYEKNPYDYSYNLSLRLEINAELDPEVIRTILQQLMDRHDQFRATFFSQNGIPCQKISKSIEVPFRIMDVSGCSNQKLEGLIKKDSLRPFDLHNGPPCDFILYSQGPREHLLALNCHHIIIDGWSGGGVYPGILPALSGKIDRYPVATAAPTSRISRFCLVAAQDARERCREAKQRVLA